MSASERLKALEARSAVGPWTYYEDSDVVDGGNVALLLDEDPELSRLIVALRNALPQIVAVVEAAEAVGDYIIGSKFSMEEPFVSERIRDVRAALTALDEALR